MILLEDQFAPAAPLALADAAFGSLTIGIGDGVMTITVTPPGAVPPPIWLLAGGAWIDALSWDDNSFWEDS